MKKKPSYAGFATNSRRSGSSLMEFATMSSVFPIIIITLFTLAAIPYAMSGDWPRAWFYLFSAFINITVVFIK